MKQLYYQIQCVSCREPEVATLHWNSDRKKMMEIKVIICVLAELVVACASWNYSAQCKSVDDVQSLQVIQGEGLRLIYSDFINNSLIFWFKKGRDGIQPITTEEEERVHYQDAVLYFLPLSRNDTGIYVTQWWDTTLECSELETKLVVDEEFKPEQLHENYFEKMDILKLSCPVWEDERDAISWYKDFQLIPDKSDNELEVYLPLEESKGIYTCVSTWERRGQRFNTSGSLRVLGKDDSVAMPPTFLHPTNNSVLTVDLGMEVKLNCQVFFGINTSKGRSVFWMRDGPLNLDHRRENRSTWSTYTIGHVSESDLQYNYCCIATSPYEWRFVCITLKTRASVFVAVVAFSCTALFLLLAAATLKRFTVDLVLFLRSFKILQRKRHDGKVYDAYVIYHKDKMDDMAANFVNKVLPDVLENACGFKLYIPGRDDLPGEDCTEAIEVRMRLSRRLVAVLPPGASQSPGVMTPLCYDWHVGLHRVLVEQELRLILIQLGDMNDYAHLPLGLQHLLQKTPPLRWDEGSGRATCPSSCFWKKVRYMMPVPSESSSQDADVQF